MSFRKLVRRLLEDIGFSDSRVEISSPMNFEHRVHVFLDAETGRYIGLPPQWADLIGNKARRKVRRTESSPDMLAAKRRNAAIRRTDASTESAPQTWRRERNANLAGSLDKPRSRSSVADDQDIIIERLKRELRDYKMSHPSEFNSMLENFDSAVVDRPLTHSRHEYQNGGTSRQNSSWTSSRSSATKQSESAV